jgi:hypothetical protein
MLGFALAPLFPRVACQEIFIRLPLSADFWLVKAGFFVVQSIHIHRVDDGFDWAWVLNSKKSGALAKKAWAGKDRPFNSDGWRQTSLARLRPRARGAKIGKSL